MLQSVVAASVLTSLLLVPTILVTRHAVAAEVEVVGVEASIAAVVVEVAVVVEGSTVEVVVEVVEAQPTAVASMISKAGR